MNLTLTRVFRATSLALVTVLMAGCASLAGPRDIEVPLSKLQSGLDRRFPLNSRALDLFDVELVRPRLTMLPDTGRIAIALEASISPPFLRQRFGGNLALSGRLFLDPARNAIMVAEPRVERFSVDGLDDRGQRQLTKVANTLMDTAIVDVPLYHFRPEDLRYGGVQFVPTAITTTPRGLVVSVAPAVR